MGYSYVELKSALQGIVSPALAETFTQKKISKRPYQKTKRPIITLEGYQNAKSMVSPERLDLGIYQSEIPGQDISYRSQKYFLPIFMSLQERLAAFIFLRMNA